MSGELRGLHTRRLGRSAQYLPSVDSTNRWLKQHADELTDGTLCWTQDQTAGRGRRDRVWSAEPGQTLAMSLLLHEQPAMDLLPLIGGLAVCRALQPWAFAPLQIKWPNDIVCGGRKLCGILCESGFDGQSRFAVVGIGVNLYQTAGQFAATGLPLACSLSMLSPGMPLPEAGEIAATILNELEPLWDALRLQGFATLRGAYEDKCINLGKAVQVLSPDGAVLLSGKAVGIADDGRLLVDTGEECIPVNAGEVSVRGEQGYV